MQKLGLIGCFLLFCLFASRPAQAQLVYYNTSSTALALNTLDSISTNGSGQATLFTATGPGLNNVSRCTALAVDASNGKLFFFDGVSNSLWSANLNGSGLTLVKSGLIDFPTDLALDPVNQKVYYTTSSSIQGNNTVQRVDYTGNNNTTLFTATGSTILRCTAIALDVSNSKIFIADAGAAKIWSMDLTGNGVTALTSASDSIPTGVAVDGGNQQVYFTLGSPVQGANVIQRVSYTGSGLTTLFNAAGSVQRCTALDLDLAHGLIYLSDAGASALWQLPIGGGSATPLLTELPATAKKVRLPVSAVSTASVTSVTSTPANAYYAVSQNVPVAITFSGPVNVTGTPQLALNDGGTATYVGGTGTATLTFNYVVGAGETSSHLGYASVNALILNGGTVNSTNGTAAVLTLPAPGSAGSLGANTTLVIDTTLPTVTISAPSATAITNGSEVSYTVTFTDDNLAPASLPALEIETNQTGTATFTNLTVTPDGGTATTTNFLVTLSGFAGNGTVGITLPAGATLDLAENQSLVSTSQTFQVRTILPTVTTLAASPNPAVFGQSVTLTATVTPSNATGTVTFYDGATSLGMVASTNGVAGLALSTLTVSGHDLTAVYSGDFNFSGSTSSITVETINQASVQVAMVTMPAQPVFGQPVRLQANVTAMSPGVGIPTGKVVFASGTSFLTTNTLVNGVAFVTNSTFQVGSNVVMVSYLGDLNFSGNGISQDVVVGFASTTNLLTTSPNPSVYGQAVTFTATVNAAAPGVGTPTGTVTFHDGATILGTNTLNGSRMATLTVSNLTAAHHVITAAYSGDGSFTGSTSMTLTQVVNLASTTVTVTAPVNPTVFGQSVTFTATVAAVAPGAGVPTGIATFFYGTTNLGSGTLVNGVATLATASLGVGDQHNITATYAGDANFSTNRSAIWEQVVDSASSTNTLLTLVNPTMFGQPAVFTVTIGAVSPGAGTPTGTVTFYYNLTNGFGTNLLVNGATSITNTALPVGTNSITAVYSGDVDFDPSTAGTNQVVNQAATTNVLALAVNPSVSGQPVTFTATISAMAPGAGVPTGTVTFYDGATVLGTNTLNGSQVATLTISNLPTGNQAIEAAYAGDGNFTSSTSLVLTQNVNQAGTTTTVTAPVNPTVFGQSVTFTATVAPVAPGAGTPTGSVTFFDGTANLGNSSLVNGVATLATASLGAGAEHDITATYTGDANFSTSTSVIWQQVVDSASTANTLLVLTNPTVFGQPAVFTATIGAVSPGVGTPTGTVTFYYGLTNSFGTNLLVNGVTSITNTALPVGTNFITAVYSGDVDFSASTAGTNQVVNQAATTNALAVDINPSVSGQSVTFTATISALAPGAGVPTGTVTFFANDTNNLGTNALVNGLASVTSSTLAVGTSIITAVYSGDANFTASSALALTQTVLSLTNSQTLSPSVVNDTNTFFLQTGLMQQLITVSNVTDGAYTAVRVTLHLTQVGITVYDATGTNSSGDPYLQYNYPVPPHTSVTFSVEYYVANRTTIPTPTVTVTLTPAEAATPIPAGTVQPIVQALQISPNQTFLLGFRTQLNANYYVLYSSDLVNWTVSLPAVKGNGSAVQWLDLGPPLTQAPTSSQPQRFYKVIHAQ